MHLLLLAIQTATPAPSTAFDVLKFSAVAAAFVLGLLRLLDTARPLWSAGGIVPQKLQPVAIALVAILPDLATGFQHVANVQDLANVVLAGVVGFFTSMRGQLPDNHLAKLDEDTHKKLAKVQKRKTIKVKPAALVGMALFLLLGCAGLGSAVNVLGKIAMIAADASNAVSVAQSIADDYYRVAPAPEKQAAVNAVLQETRNALAESNQLADAAKDDLKKADAAYDGFRKAYKALQQAFATYGVGANPHARSAPLREPLAMKPLEAP